MLAHFEDMFKPSNKAFKARVTVEVGGHEHSCGDVVAGSELIDGRPLSKCKDHSLDAELVQGVFHIVHVL